MPPRIEWSRRRAAGRTCQFADPAWGADPWWWRRGRPGTVPGFSAAKPSRAFSKRSAGRAPRFQICRLEVIASLTVDALAPAPRSNAQLPVYSGRVGFLGRRIRTRPAASADVHETWHGI